MSEGFAARAKMVWTAASPDVYQLVRKLFYCCQFDEAICLVDQAIAVIDDHRKVIDLQLFKINALYETHNAGQAKSILEQLVRTPLNNAPAALNYARGRLAYFDHDFSHALSMFESLKQLSDDAILRFRGLLGVANVHYSQQSFELIPQVLAQLSTNLGDVNPEDRISFEILMGNYYRSAGIDRCLARKYFQRGLAQASSQSWSYFICRCLYGIATIERDEQNHHELRYLLNLLKSMLSHSEAAYFRYLVNEKFKDEDFVLATPIEFDRHRMRLRIDDQWHHFHNKPLLFKFMMLLHSSTGFVDKAEIAAKLWPNQRYLPRTHDPRIFDIAKRIRAVIERYDHNPVLLLSGRQGYKLASDKNYDTTHALRSISGGKTDHA